MSDLIGIYFSINDINNINNISYPTPITPLQEYADT